MRRTREQLLAHHIGELARRISHLAIGLASTEPVDIEWYLDKIAYHRRMITKYGGVW